MRLMRLPPLGAIAAPTMPAAAAAALCHARPRPPAAGG